MFKNLDDELKKFDNEHSENGPDIKDYAGETIGAELIQQDGKTGMSIKLPRSKLPAMMMLTGILSAMAEEANHSIEDTLIELTLFAISQDLSKPE